MLFPGHRLFVSVCLSTQHHLFTSVSPRQAKVNQDAFVVEKPLSKCWRTSSSWSLRKKISLAVSYHLLWWFLIFQSSQSAWPSPQLYFFFAALGESSFCVLKILRNSRNWGLASRRGNLSIVQGQQKWCRATSWMLLMVPGQVMLRSAKVFLGYAKPILVKVLWCMMQPNVMFFKCIYIYIYSIFYVYIYIYIFLRHDRHGNCLKLPPWT